MKLISNFRLFKSIDNKYRGMLICGRYLELSVREWLSLEIPISRRMCLCMYRDVD